jgi:hypothetical protein
MSIAAFSSLSNPVRPVKAAEVHFSIQCRERPYTLSLMAFAEALSSAALVDLPVSKPGPTTEATTSYIHTLGRHSLERRAARTVVLYGHLPTTHWILDSG